MSSAVLLEWWGPEDSPRHRGRLEDKNRGLGLEEVPRGHDLEDHWPWPWPLP